MDQQTATQPLKNKKFLKAKFQKRDFTSKWGEHRDLLFPFPKMPQKEERLVDN